MALRVVVLGIPEVDFVLQRIEPAVARNIQRRAMRTVAKITVARITSLTPRDTGTMATSYRVRAIKRSRKTYGVKIVSDTRGHGRKRVETARHYAGYVEFGTKHQRGLSPMRRGLYSMKAGLKEHMRTACLEALAEASKKWKKKYTDG